MHIHPIYFDGDSKAVAIIHLLVLEALFRAKRLAGKSPVIRALLKLIMGFAGWLTYTSSNRLYTTSYSKRHDFGTFPFLLLLLSYHGKCNVHVIFISVNLCTKLQAVLALLPWASQVSVKEANCATHSDGSKTIASFKLSHLVRFTVYLHISCLAS